jgi:mannobiose 2-epimerase
LDLFFDDNRKTKSTIISYGHDIEASWLIEEAARVPGDQELLHKVQKICIKIAEASCKGLQSDESPICKFNKTKNHIDKDKRWWVQSEAIVGYLNSHKLSGDKK